VLPGTGLEYVLQSTQGALTPELWNGLGLNGQLLASGVYTLQLQQTNSGGTSILQSAQVVLLRGGAALSAAAHVVPNPAGAGANGGSELARVVYTPNARGLAHAEVYNMAGERVLAGDDPSQSGSITLDLSHIAPGPYFIAFTLRQRETVLAQQIIKMAVIR